ncbi:MAG: DNA polymerase III subunit gamma/tau [Candidatus Omnitrophica bacterium]|nr:DNA polymerase III subunit gamma/tau [Candidatus Omnitrophota bacterium]MBU4590572.1 DNA polymerase III subunit gamma/tau [Candidatus Omnitrophota bacterium]
MNYLPFARKWRPQEFDEVVGQEHITTTLKNAILLKRVHHAYLFTGPRGIGKTSTARIFSKALNCDKGPIPKPCSTCPSCQEIVNGSSLDVIEIDGASNNGVDEIRNLRETVKFSPSRGRYKIYIIDEVHMLTVPAFNALLKTLEEPPQHVKFIFATTEPHKLPATILSRCQRFDFRRISIKEIMAKLKEVAEKEKLDIEDSVFLYIAKAADGSMRDAESVLDQVASFSNGKIKLKDVVESLGMIEDEVLFRSADLIINKDTKGAIHLVGEILNSGRDAKQFLSEMLEHFRNIMIAKCGVSSEELIDLPKEAIERVKKQAQSLSQGDIFYIMNVISNSLRMIKQLLPERIVLELCMIKLTSRDSIVSIEEMISKLPQASEVVRPATATSAPIVSKPVSNPEHHSTQQQSFAKKIQQSVKQVVKPLSQQKASVEMTRVKDAWPILVKAMAVKRMSISSYLGEGQPENMKGDTIFVGLPRELNFHREVLEEKQNKGSIEAALSQILDTPIKLQFILTDRKAEAIGDAGEPAPVLTKDELKKKEPIIDSALNIFGGKILRARNT